MFSVVDPRARKESQPGGMMCVRAGLCRALVTFFSDAEASHGGNDIPFGVNHVLFLAAIELFEGGTTG